MTRFVVDCETLLRIAAGEIEVAAEHKLVAPTLVRSQALSALYQLQADAFITSDRNLARAVAGLVDTATSDALQTGERIRVGT
jgi:hypothetical protein